MGTPGRLYRDRSPTAKNWLKGAVIVWLVLFLFGLLFPQTGFVRVGGWTNRYLVSVVAVMLPLVAAWFMHRQDRRSKKIRGIGHVYESQKPKLLTDPTVIRGIISRESVQV